MDFTDKRVLVVGTGVSGVAAIRLLAAKGAKPVVLEGNEKADREQIRAKIPESITYDLIIGNLPEEVMDTLMEQMEDNSSFILPGGTPVSAQLQFARTVARRAERRLWTLHKQDPLPEIILRFINRLSDLFFVMARYEMQQQNWTEEKWQSFAYKRKKKE